MPTLIKGSNIADGSITVDDINLGDLNTDNVTEGSNLYFTTARARESISVSGDLSYDSNTGVIGVTVPAGYDSSDFNTDFAAKSTTDLSEGTNLYYTTARANTDIDARVTKTFVDALNVNADTLDSKQLATIESEYQAYADAAVAALANSAPGTLDTLNELAAALGDDPDFATTVSTNIGTKADKTITISAGTGLTGGGDLSANRSLALATSGVTAGSYGSASEVPAITVDAYGRITSISTNNVAGVSTFAYDSANAVFTIGTADGSSFDATLDLTAFDTGDVAEGSNLYYTDARARDAISVSGDLAYNSTTGVVSFTERTDAEVRALVSATGDLSYNSTTGVFSVSTYKSTDFDTDFSGKSTTDLSEGTNLYYTDTRVRNAVSASGDLSYNSTTGVFSVTTYKSTDFDSDFSGKSTTDLSEGTNLYHTTARARGAISATGDVAYNSTTGVISFTERTDAEVRGLISATGDLSYNSTTGVVSFTERTDAEVRGLISVTDAGGDGSLSYNSTSGVITYTGPSAAETRAHFSGGTGVTYNSSTGAISIGQDVSTSSNVTFANGTFSGDVQIDGDFTVSGNVVTVNVQELSVEDNLIYLNANSAQTNPDLGWAGSYNDGTYAHAGLFRDATDGVFKVFDGYTPEPDASAFIDTAHASFNLANIEATKFIGALEGNADTASALATARTIALGGDVSGSASFNGTSNITITATVADDSHNHTIANVDGLQTALNGKLGTTANAVSATKLATARTIALGGDVSGSASFDGTANITITATIADDSHNHTIANVDGLQTALNGKQAAGTYNTIIGTDTDINTSGSTIIDNIFVTDGVITSMGTRVLTLGDLGYSGATNADNYNGWDLFTDGTNRGRITTGENVNFVGGTNVTLGYSATNNTITINSTDTNTTYSAGSNLSLSGTTFNVSSSPTFSGTVTALDFNSTSDVRTKKNIVTIENASDKVAALRGVNFDWKHNDVHAMGVIAQEVEQVIPEVVGVDEEGNRSVNYASMVGVLIEAIKDLQQKVAELESK